jgi:hypothetical protein
MVGAVNEECKNMATLPTVEVILNGKSYPLKPENYLLLEEADGETACMNGWMSMDVPAYMDGFVILGDLFIKTYYAHYDLANNQVGFAVAAPS